MPEHIRALIVILALAVAAYYLASRTIKTTVPHGDFTRRRNLWFALTLIAFLAHNPWIYFFLAGSTLIIAMRIERSPLALYFSILFVLPVAYVQIPGLGLINYIFELSHQRLLVLLILVPAFLKILSQKKLEPYGSTLPDKLLVGYLILIVALYLRETTLTDTLRQAFYMFIDVFLPYFVISRSIRNIEAYREVLHCFVIAVMITATIASFEIIKGWILYDRLIELLNLTRASIGYTTRAGLVRAVASLGQPIVLGYAITVAIGFFLYLNSSIKARFFRRAAFFILFCGLLASLSRGPWVGAAFVILIFTLSGKHAFKNLLKLAMLSVACLSVLIVLPGGERFSNLLPFFGDTEQHTITYRQQLFENSLIVINRHPILGSVNYLETPEMEAMRQGEGIIDIVNTYIGVALESGLVGLGLFLGFFLAICWGIIISLRRHSNKTSEIYLLGRSLLATMAGSLVTIATVSNISAIPVILWAVAGLGAGFVNMEARRKKSNNSTSPLTYSEP